MFKKENNLSPFSVPLNEAGVVDGVILCDDFEGQDFNKGANGFAKSLIEQIITAESEELRNNLMKRLVEKSGSSLPADMPASEAIKQIMPKSISSVAAFRDWIGELDGTSIAKAVDGYKAQLEQAAKEKEELRKFREAQLNKKTDEEIIKEV